MQYEAVHAKPEGGRLPSVHLCTMKLYMQNLKVEDSHIYCGGTMKLRMQTPIYIVEVTVGKPARRTRQSPESCRTRRSRETEKLQRMDESAPQLLGQDGPSLIGSLKEEMVNIDPRKEQQGRQLLGCDLALTADDNSRDDNCSMKIDPLKESHSGGNRSTLHLAWLRVHPERQHVVGADGNASC